MKILGISAYYHDSAAALTIDGNIIAAAQEERFTRKKHDAGFPEKAIIYCLEEAGLELSELDAVAFYDKPLLKFERLLETYYAFAPKGIISFLTAMPPWLKEKLFLRKIIKQELEKISPVKDLKILFPEHHLSHAASAFYPSPFDRAAILTIDGVGEWATASISLGDGNSIRQLKEMKFPHSLGLFYSAVTYFLGFRVNSGEYKLMGLAPYGNPESASTKNFISAFLSEIIHINSDGSVWLNQKYFTYSTGLKMIDTSKWESLFGLSKRDVESEILQEHCDMALACQKVTEEAVLKMAMHAKELTNTNKLCMAGGVALNCVSNGKIESAAIFSDIFIQPASGDAGGSVGAALAAEYLYFSGKRTVSEKDSMKGSYLGPDFSDTEISRLLKKKKVVFNHFKDFNELTDKVANLLKEGKAFGWFRGRMEFGPRALGNRSILADPGNEEVQKRLNLQVKFRESFRPFAPAVLEEDASEYFKLCCSSPYMLLVAEVKEEQRYKLPEDYLERGLREKLYLARSPFPAVTHVDFSARVQTVTKESNGDFYTLLHKFKQVAGYGMLVNTSFNVRGEPIVCTPEDAYRCFLRTDLDYLVLGNYLIKRSEQQIPDDFRKDYELIMD